MADPLKPSPAILCKVGSIVRHVEEAMGPSGHGFDATVVQAMLGDSEVVEWMAAMDAMALLPVKRDV